MGWTPWKDNNIQTTNGTNLRRRSTCAQCILPSRTSHQTNGRKRNRLDVNKDIKERTTTEWASPIFFVPKKTVHSDYWSTIKVKRRSCQIFSPYPLNRQVHRLTGGSAHHLSLRCELQLLVDLNRRTRRRKECIYESPQLVPVFKNAVCTEEGTNMLRFHGNSCVFYYQYFVPFVNIQKCSYKII